MYEIEVEKNINNLKDLRDRFCTSMFTFGSFNVRPEAYESGLSLLDPQKCGFLLNYWKPTENINIYFRLKNGIRLSDFEYILPNCVRIVGINNNKYFNEITNIFLNVSERHNIWEMDFDDKNIYKRIRKIVDNTQYLSFIPPLFDIQMLGNMEFSSLHELACCIGTLYFKERTKYKQIELSNLEHFYFEDDLLAHFADKADIKVDELTTAMRLYLKRALDKLGLYNVYSEFDDVFNKQNFLPELLEAKNSLPKRYEAYYWALALFLKANYDYEGTL